MNAPDVTTRPATAKDSDFVFELRRLALGPYVEATWGWDEAFQRELHDRRFQGPTLDILLVGSEAIGALKIERHDAEIRLVSIYVHPDWQSKGIGSRILDALVWEATTRVVPIRLTVLCVNVRAIALYQRFGFQIVDTTKTHHGMRRPATPQA